MADSVSGPIHALCDRYVDDYAALDPNAATHLGVPGHDDRLTDYSPEGHRARAELHAATLRAIRAATPRDDSETAARAVFTERVGLDLEIHEAGLDSAELNVIESPVQNLCLVFDLMPNRTPDDWSLIAARLARMPEAMTNLEAGLRHAAAGGRVSALRQVTKTAAQCDTWADGHFAGLVAPAEVPPGLRADLDAGAAAASAAFAGMARFLREELAPAAPAGDAVGPDAYALWLRFFTGAELDLKESYAWGWEEFCRIETELKQVAGRIGPGATPAEAAAALDADPDHRLHGADALREWMQRLSDAALADLRGSHFEIPDALMALECLIAPPGGIVGAYYTGPSDDFSRPGRMWWSIPPGQTDFPTWREVTTVYHEGVPGHHLQVATAVHQSGRLNRFQRLMAHVSGYSEGWALYAERLMRELGRLDDDGDLLGMLAGQLFRAARVIVDIGMHLELPIPVGTGFHEGERWTPELGLEFMLTRTITQQDQVRDEIDRYLGWPGQAPSYKLGERQWLAARDDARARQGAAFDQKAFHTAALKLGAMGLDTLRDRLALL
ncbi:DUF885 domain-containing protein [Streptomyces sp. NA02950]|uniref:DUF885 domain-containing protein n=1 Tax=Streptomyces sp. NA02950 TaxID=2742137 RepID=UPI00159211AA|nr:DUF885 domain-containing protein [Streptomyces sp. NA02950]QKV91480.1 DUF885 domain-containing protein [Streptomyces sp. NA02950]